MMLSHLNNTVFIKNIRLSLNHNIHCNNHYHVSHFNLCQFMLNECKKNILHKEVQFENVFTKNKNKDKKNIILTNFVVNNLLNIVNIKNVTNNFYIKNNTCLNKQKKKINDIISPKIFNHCKNKEKNNTIQNTKHKSCKLNQFFHNITDTKNKSFLLHNNITFNLSKKNYIKNNLNKTSNLNIIKNNLNYNKNNLFFKNLQYNKSNTLLKNIQKYQQPINEINSLKKSDINNIVKSYNKFTSTLDSKENIQWKKAIRQQILLAISNRENTAEISLQPKYLGSIYIKIKIKRDQAKLKLLSNNIKVQKFLNSCIPFLKNSLIKNGIFLKKVDINSSLNLKKNNNVITSKYKFTTFNDIKNCYNNLTKNKVIDMYV